MIIVHSTDAPDRSLPVPDRTRPLLSLLREAGFSLSAPCGGAGHCGNCRVRVIGDVSEPDAEELQLLDKECLARDVRLTCRTWLTGENAEIFLTESAFISSPLSVSALQPPIQPLGKSLGIAIDLGTTTIAAALYDLKNGALLAEKTVRNPQAAFGADVISRLQAARKDACALAEAARNAIVQLTKELCSSAHCDCLPDAAVLTANTAMLCLLFGYPVQTLARAPFALPHTFGETMPLSTLLPHASGTLLIPPCIGPFLGADLVTAMLDTNLLHAQRPTVLLDLGTNGEIALFDGKTLTCCSTAAGPAFEGAGIRMGCDAVSGAIDRVLLEDGNLVCRTIGNLPAVGLCGSGLLDAIACLLDTNKLDPSGRLLGQSDRVVLGSTRISLYQQDVRAVQSAKAAIRAGLETLCSATGVERPDLLLAGGFGSTLCTDSAARIGLIPKDAAARARAVGNAALRGAAKLLMDSALLDVCHHIAASADTIDLSANPAFTQRYLAQMQF